MTLYEELTDPVAGFTIGIMVGMTVDIVFSVIDHYKSRRNFDEQRKYEYAIGSGTGIGSALTFIPEFFPLALVLRSVIGPLTYFQILFVTLP